MPGSRRHKRDARKYILNRDSRRREKIRIRLTVGEFSKIGEFFYNKPMRFLTAGDTEM